MELGKVQSADDDQFFLKNNDPMMNILSKQLINTDENWEVLAADGCGEYCERGVIGSQESDIYVHAMSSDDISRYVHI